MGTPTEETWPGVTSLPDYIQFKHQTGTRLRDIFTAAGDDLLDLLTQLLTLCPLQVNYFYLKYCKNLKIYTKTKK
jgi:cyclin-dependent kinase 7